MQKSASSSLFGLSTTYNYVVIGGLEENGWRWRRRLQLDGEACQTIQLAGDCRLVAGKTIQLRTLIWQSWLVTVFVRVTEPIQQGLLNPSPSPEVRYRQR